MKYRCDMVKDLMPLCLDHEASESSEQTVIEHLAEGLLQNVIEFFRDPKSREEIEKWQQEQKTEKKP